MVEEHKVEINVLKTKIDSKMGRTSSIKNNVQEKAKAQNEKHQHKTEQIQEELKTQADTKKTQIEEKLVSAANRREEVIEQVKQTAAQSIVLKKPSPAKEEEQIK